jgi:hypothetical protein
MATNLQRVTGRSWPVGDQMRRQLTEPIEPLHLCLLEDLQHIVDFDSKVTRDVLLAAPFHATVAVDHRVSEGSL